MQSEKMDYKAELAKVAAYIGTQERIDAGNRCGRILESLLKEVYGKIIIKVSDSKTRNKILEIEEAIGGGKTYESFELGNIVRLYRQARIFNEAENYLGVRLTHSKKLDIDALPNIRNACAHPNKPPPSVNEIRIFYNAVQTILWEFGYIDAESEWGEASTSKQESVGEYAATIHLKRFFSLRKEDFILQAVIWIPLLVILYGVYWALNALFSFEIAIVGWFGLLVVLIAFAWWFYLPKQRSGNLGASFILDEHTKPVKIVVDTRIGWKSTGVLLAEARAYHFKVSGHIAHSAFSGEHPAEGNPQPISPRSKIRNCENFNVGALVGKIGLNGQPFAVGHGDTVHTFPESGILFLAINDWPSFDNRGEFTVLVFPSRLGGLQAVEGIH